MRSTHVLAIAVGILLPSAWGCEKRQAVAGTVNFEGRPLPRGMIEFEPVSEEKPSTASSAVIVKGKYAIPVKHGLLPGTYRVRIISANDPDAAVGVFPPGQEKGPGEDTPGPTLEDHDKAQPGEKRPEKDKPAAGLPPGEEEKSKPKEKAPAPSPKPPAGDQGKSQPGEKRPGESAAVSGPPKRRVPARYNSETTLHAEVTKGGRNMFDFDLKE